MLITHTLLGKNVLFGPDFSNKHSDCCITCTWTSNDMMHCASTDAALRYQNEALIAAFNSVIVSHSKTVQRTIPILRKSSFFTPSIFCSDGSGGHADDVRGAHSAAGEGGGGEPGEREGEREAQTQEEPRCFPGIETSEHPKHQ